MAPPPPPPSHIPKPVVRDSAADDGGKIWLCLNPTTAAIASRAATFELAWVSPDPDSYDWIGVFPYAWAEDDNYVINQWQYATNASPYMTQVLVRPGYQARYMRWDATVGRYVSVLPTAPFPWAVKANQLDLSRWMYEIFYKKGSRLGLPLSAVTLPGTHDSASWGMYLPLVNTQSLSIADQLRAGIRFLDMRLGMGVNPVYGLQCFHAQWNLWLTFTKALEDVFVFLDEHPEEVVVMSIKNDNQTDGTVFYTRLWDDHIAPNLDRFLLSDDVPTLRQAKGKIVVLRRFGPPPPACPVFGLNFAQGWQDNSKAFKIQYRSKSGGAVTGYVQDFYDTGNVTDKDAAFKAMLLQAAAGSSSDIYVNFSSASGTKNPADKTWSPYWVADHVNEVMSYLVFNNTPGRLGWVLMDFPDSKPSLIHDLVATNLPTPKGHRKRHLAMSEGGF
jgi:1-phosphatidylinositol phosphodiesterase